MRKIIVVLSIVVLFITGCGNSSSKLVLDKFELGKTTYDEISESDTLTTNKVWNEEKSIYEYGTPYIKDYDINGVTGDLFFDYDGYDLSKIEFTSSADNNVDSLQYLISQYGDKYKETSEYSVLWTEGKNSISYDLSDDGIVTIIWQ